MNTVVYTYPNPQVVLLKGQVEELYGFIFSLDCEDENVCKKIPLIGKMLQTREPLTCRENMELFHIAEKGDNKIDIQNLVDIREHAIEWEKDYGKTLKSLAESGVKPIKVFSQNLSFVDGTFFFQINDANVWTLKCSALESTYLEDLVEVVLFAGISLDDIEIQEDDEYSKTLMTMLRNVLAYNGPVCKALLQEYDTNDVFWINDGIYSYNNKDFSNPVLETRESFNKRFYEL